MCKTSKESIDEDNQSLTNGVIVDQRTAETKELEGILKFNDCVEKMSHRHTHHEIIGDILKIHRVGMSIAKNKRHLPTDIRQTMEVFDARSFDHLF